MYKNLNWMFIMCSVRGNRDSPPPSIPLPAVTGYSWNLFPPGIQWPAHACRDVPPYFSYNINSSLHSLTHFHTFAHCKTKTRSTSRQSFHVPFVDILGEPPPRPLGRATGILQRSLGSVMSHLNLIWIWSSILRHMIIKYSQRDKVLGNRSA